MTYYNIALSNDDVSILRRALASFIDADSLTVGELTAAIRLYSDLYDAQTEYNIYTEV